MSKPLFLLDVDGVVANFQDAVQRCFAEVCPDEKLDLSVWDFTKTLSPAAAERYKIASASPGFATALEPYKGAKAAIKQLRKICDVVAVTAPLKHAPTWCHDRKLWLQKHFGLQASDVVFTSRKDLVVGDFLLDDKFENVRQWGDMWDRVHNDGHQRALLWANLPHHEQHRPDPVMGSSFAYITSWSALIIHVVETIENPDFTPIRCRDFH